jgi:hypothetical protein
MKKDSWLACPDECREGWPPRLGIRSGVNRDQPVALPPDSSWHPAVTQVFGERERILRAWSEKLREPAARSNHESKESSLSEEMRDGERAKSILPSASSAKSAVHACSVRYLNGVKRKKHRFMANRSPPIPRANAA